MKLKLPMSDSSLSQSRFHCELCQPLCRWCSGRLEPECMFEMTISQANDE